MSSEGRFDLIQKAGLAVWAFATVLLFFIALLLAQQIIDLGATPMAVPEQEADSGESGGVLPGAAEREIEEERAVTLYFASESGDTLTAESRTIPLSGYTQENCRRALEALIEGPRQNGRFPILPPGVEVRGLYLIEGGGLAIDFSAELRYESGRPKSHAAETLMTYGVVNTLTHPGLRGDDGASVSRVYFLFTGRPMDDSFPEHIDLTEPISPDSSWLANSEPSPDYAG